MLRSLVMSLVAGALAAGCAAPAPHAVRYCSLISYTPCLEQQRSGNCQPCPNQD
jgi:hypothetical protein